MRQEIQVVAIPECPHQLALVRYSASPGDQHAGAVGSRWRRFGVVALAGMVLGATAAAIGSKGELKVTSPAVTNAPSVKSYVISPVVESVSVSEVRRTDRDAAASQEFERLQIRNRRLEALVTVLRERAGQQTEGVTEERNPVTLTYAAK